jgi:hypothetical protein
MADPPSCLRVMRDIDRTDPQRSIFEGQPIRTSTDGE